MVVVKPLKLYMFYGIFMALYYVLISMSTFTFKVCSQIPYSEAFYFAETIQLIRDASQVSGFCMVQVFTAKNVRADYLFCCFDIINYHVVQYLGRVLAQRTYQFLTQMPVSIDQWKGKLVVSIIALHQISFSAHMMPEFLFKIYYLY